MRHNKLIFRQLSRDVFWLIFAIIQFILGYNLDSSALMFIASSYFAINSVLLVQLIADMIIKDDVGISGTIIENHDDIIVIETERKKKRQIVKKHVGLKDIQLGQQIVIIETRRTAIVCGAEIISDADV